MNNEFDSWLIKKSVYLHLDKAQQLTEWVRLLNPLADYEYEYSGSSNKCKQIIRRFMSNIIISFVRYCLAWEIV